MRETTLATLDDAGCAAAFNAVYQGYVIPFTVEASWAARHLAANDIDPAHSPLWLDDDGRVVGLAALGVREARGWVGGFGIAPEYRGRGLAHGLIAATLRAARDLGLATVQLEVIAGNTGAIRTYERAGFARVRDLRIFAHPAVPPVSPERLWAASATDLLPRGAQLRAARPAWQREPASLAHQHALSGLALGPADAPAAYVLYSATETNAAILDFAAPDVETAAALAAALPAHLPGRTLRLANEPEESPVCAALDQLGWRETLRQHEMLYTC